VKQREGFGSVELKAMYHNHRHYQHAQSPRSINALNQHHHHTPVPAQAGTQVLSLEVRYKINHHNLISHTPVPASAGTQVDLPATAGTL
jgi:hypothetical protein